MYRNKVGPSLSIECPFPGKVPYTVRPLILGKDSMFQEKWKKEGERMGAMTTTPEPSKVPSSALLSLRCGYIKARTELKYK